MRSLLNPVRRKSSYRERRGKGLYDVKYWLTDAAVSLLNLSEQRAREAQARFEEQLTKLEPLAGRRRHPQ